MEQQYVIQAYSLLCAARFRLSKKWLSATFSSFSGFASRISSRAAKPERYENLKVFIRSDVHAVRAGIKLKGLPPLKNPAFFRQAKAYSLLCAARLFALYLFKVCIKVYLPCGGQLVKFYDVCHTLLVYVLYHAVAHYVVAHPVAHVQPLLPG